MRTKEDPFLSEILDCPCGVVTRWAPPWDFGKHGFLTFKANDLKGLRGALTKGFRHVTTNVYLKKVKDNGLLPPSGQVEEKFSIGPLKKKEISEVLEIAGESFTLDRFHQDPKLGKQLADLIHERWVENDCKGRADTVLVARVKDRVVGFLALCGRSIDLTAVRREFTNKGVGTALLWKALNQYGASETVTQINNRVLSLYRRAGFVVSRIYHVLHWWRN